MVERNEDVNASADADDERTGPGDQFVYRRLSGRGKKWQLSAKILVNAKQDSRGSAILRYEPARVRVRDDERAGVAAECGQKLAWAGDVHPRNRAPF